MTVIEVSIEKSRNEVSCNNEVNGADRGPF